MGGFLGGLVAVETLLSTHHPMKLGSASLHNGQNMKAGVQGYGRNQHDCGWSVLQEGTSAIFSCLNVLKILFVK
jgi:hypothetical protein